MAIVPRISHGILSLVIGSKEALLKAYMPFITNGGLFIPTSRSYQLGEEVFMLMTLMEEPDKIPVTGRVIWVTPKASAGGRIPGIGIQLSTEDSSLVRKIENYLAGALGQGRRTNTL